MDFAAVIVVGVLLFILLRQEIRRIEARVQHSHDDDAIDKQVREAVVSYDRHIEKLTSEKKQLPAIDLWAISSNPQNWEAQLIGKSEALRSLAEEAYGYGPDTYTITQHADRMPMTYAYAHALADFAHLRKDLSIKSLEWSIKKIQLLGMMRKRHVDLPSIVDVEGELREIELKRANLERLYESKRKAICDAVFDKMKESWSLPDPQGAGPAA